MMRLITRLVWVVALITCACARPEKQPRAQPGAREPSQSVPASVRALLVAHLQPQDSSQIRISADTSSAVPNLIYYRGWYLPPNTVHVVHEAVVATRGSEPVLVRTADDWWRASRAYQPRSSAEVLNMCVEVLQLSSRTGLRPIIYDGPASLGDPSVFLANREMLRDSLTRRGRPPTAVLGASGSWDARFWAVAVRHVIDYECQVSRTGISLAGRDTILDHGIIPGY